MSLTAGLGAPCFQALTLRGLASASALKACRIDYDRLCAHTGPGLNRGLACMLDNAQALDPTCRDALAKQGYFDDEPAIFHGVMPYHDGQMQSWSYAR